MNYRVRPGVRAREGGLGRHSTPDLHVSRSEFSRRQCRGHGGDEERYGHCRVRARLAGKHPAKGVARRTPPLGDAHRGWEGSDPSRNNADATQMSIGTKSQLRVGWWIWMRTWRINDMHARCRSGYHRTDLPCLELILTEPFNLHAESYAVQK